METNGIHRPDPENSHTPYFPDETIAKCRRDLTRVLKPFAARTIVKLRTALKNRQVSGMASKSDLIGTLAQIQTKSRSEKVILEKRIALYKKIGRRPGRHNDFEFWFMQISGKPTLGKHVTQHKCIFTEITVAWLTSIIKHLKQTQLRNKGN